MATPIDPIDEGPPERQQFFRQLLDFHRDRGSPIPKMPVLGKREVDLHELYERVKQRGGIREVVINRRWPEIVKLMPLPKTCTNAGFSLKLLYQRYLLDYERVFEHHQPDISPPPAPRGGMAIPDYLCENVALPDPYLGKGRPDHGEDAGSAPAPAAPTSDRSRKRVRAEAEVADGEAPASLSGRKSRQQSQQQQVSAPVQQAQQVQQAQSYVQQQTTASVVATTTVVDNTSFNELEEEEEEQIAEVVLRNMVAVSKRIELALNSGIHAHVDWALSVLLVQSRKKMAVFGSSNGVVLDRLMSLLCEKRKEDVLEPLLGTFFNCLAVDGAQRRARILVVLVNAAAVDDNLRVMSNSNLLSVLFDHLAALSPEQDGDVETRLNAFVVVDALVGRGARVTEGSAAAAVRVLLGEMTCRDMRQPLCVAALARLLHDREALACMGPHVAALRGGVQNVVRVLGEALLTQAGAGAGSENSLLELESAVDAINSLSSETSVAVVLAEQTCCVRLLVQLLQATNAPRSFLSLFRRCVNTLSQLARRSDKGRQSVAAYVSELIAVPNATLLDIPNLLKHVAIE